MTRLGALERELWPWAEIGTGRIGPARATFRLSEVDSQSRSDESAGWRLEFLLQSSQDPSLLVPAAQACGPPASPGRGPPQCRKVRSSLASAAGASSIGECPASMTRREASGST